ncbi:hypothetical protein SAMN04487948_101447 [Halogranum amylolyticum]|uniref:Putative peptidase inhibitor domain-containing protein n=1 Tax=Halogranum amylolyticum TaxID=660520 RepID=A0A1H8NC18_9EURY|nr:hypothetical protein [Halogranum amylolyticum]SEO27140.1 hypothetical protein SAMN04487948_101447 [Halogranum amylolyticum]
MYLSHPVRRIREDPVADESVSLVVELRDDDRDDGLDSTVEELDGSVDRDLDFSAYLVTLPETAVDELCDLDGIERIETADTISFGVDPDATAVDGDE